LEVPPAAAVVLPAGMVTEVGTAAERELLLRRTFIPPVGAAEVRVTVTVELVPPVTVLGETVREAIPGGLRVSVVVFETVPLSAMIV